MISLTKKGGIMAFDTKKARETIDRIKYKQEDDLTDIENQFESLLAEYEEAKLEIQQLKYERNELRKQLTEVKKAVNK